MKVLWSDRDDPLLSSREIDLEDLLIDIIKGGAHVGTSCAIAKLVTLLVEKKLISLQEVQDLFCMSRNFQQLSEIATDQPLSG